jgi:hypothetical protein
VGAYRDKETTHVAQKVVVELVDDIDGGPAESTITFGLDGRSYQVDLNAKNEAKLRKALEPFLKVGRRTTAAAPSRRAAKPPATGSSSEVVREWARSNGYEVSDRGRIAQAVRDAFEAAHQG